jgi:hypothetical protein
MVVGLLWDISWDASIGRDAFWSPPHIAVNFGAIAAWGAGAWLLVQATLTRHPASVGVGKLRVPLGAGFVLWGGCALLAAGALDLWWSSAYGLFPDPWSPPQILVAAGIAAILTGTLLVGASRRNGRLPASAGKPGKTPELPAATFPEELSLLWPAGLLLTFAAAATVQYNLPNLQRTALFYTVSCPLYTLILAWIGGASRLRWPASASALLYTGLVCLLVWILPLFPARPLIGPVYQPVTHMLPPQFPLLLVVPALGMDLLSRRVRGNDWMRAALFGLLFTAVFMTVQWHFAAFLLSPASGNRFWAGGGAHWPFYLQVGPERTQFWGQAQSPVTAGAVFLCGLLAVAGARIGLWLGRWTGRVRR